MLDRNATRSRTHGRGSMKLTIKGEGLSARSGYRVMLDDYDITHGLMELTLSINVEDINVAEIRIMPDEVEVDADALAKLTAQLTDGDGA